MIVAGVVRSMLSTLKNNKRDRPSAYDKLKENGLTYTTKTELHFDRKMTSAQLKELGERVKKERQMAMIRRVCFFIAAMALAIIIIGLVKL